MSSPESSFDVGPPMQKRFRSNNSPNCFQQSAEYSKSLKYSSSKNFEPLETKSFEALKYDVVVVDHCVVSEGRNDNSNSSNNNSSSNGRHLFSSPPYATAAVTQNANDTELMSNGDSGFQELNVPDDMPIYMDKTTNVNVNNKLTVMETHNGCTTSETETEESKTTSMVVNQSTSKDSQDDDSISEFSYASDLSGLSGADWKPINNNIEWIQRQIENGSDPKEIIHSLTGGEIIPDIDNMCAWRLLIRMLSEPTVRPKLDSVNTLDDVINLIKRSSKIIVLTGAGVSVSCGIPDFRSRNGIYARLSKDYPDLPDPQSMFDIHYFRKNPRPFFKFAKEIYPGQFRPSASHKFIKYMEIKDKLLRNYSQNIDTLEKAAGIGNLITCHGSFATATCTTCGYKVDSSAIKSEIFAQKIPLCPLCTEKEQSSEDGESKLHVIKPDIVFFGEGLSDDFHTSMSIDKEMCDLLIVIGSSLKVRPVALIPSSIPENIPQILINREPLNHLNFDVELLGDCDIIVRHLCKRLGEDWLEFCFDDEQLTPPREIENQFQQDEYEFVSPSRYVFPGAELNEYASDDDEDDDDGDSDRDDEERFERPDGNAPSLTTNRGRALESDDTSEQPDPQTPIKDTKDRTNASSKERSSIDTGQCSPMIVVASNDQNLISNLLTEENPSI